jgi:hypothetical protein
VTYWRRSHRFDRRALPLADRHYNRQKVGSPQFAPPGSPVVLLLPDAKALWITIRQKYAQHAWAGAWVCSCFRNESDILSSDLIREAVAVTRGEFGDPPPFGIITFVNPKKVRHKRDPGRCFLRAGWKQIGFTQGGLVVLQQLPADMPAPLPLDQLPLLGAA